uniref:DDE-1 domain-containing protein n=1 Tax=Amphimedon queenslandica TaxID=400682 RepID=A0A1X7V1Y8_AMPQE
MLVEFGGSIQLNKEWARSVFCRMGFTRKRANSKSKVLPDHFSNLKRQFLRKVEAVTNIEDIPNNLIINWDQTALKLVPSGSWTMERRGTKRVELSGINDKRQITAVLSGTLTGDFLPLQLIFKGTIAQSLPFISFPDSWHITYTENHWSINSTMIAYISHIIIPYVEKKRAELKLGPTHPALVLFLVFKGQCHENVYKLLEENNIYFFLIPANCTNKQQPLNLSVN